MAGVPFTLRDGSVGKRLPTAPKAGKVEFYFDADGEPQILRSDGTTRKVRANLTTDLDDAGDMSRQNASAVDLTGGTADSLAITGGTATGVAVDGASTVQITGKLGYATGAGGTVSQGSNKSNPVTLNALTGKITMNSANLAANTAVSFTLNNSTVEAEDQIIVSRHSGGTAGAYVVNGRATGAGTASITIRNVTGGDLAESPVLKFTVIKAVAS